MKEEVKVALVQMPAKQAVFNTEDKDENIKRIVKYIQSLGKDNDLVVFPELATSGYTPFGFTASGRIRLWNIADDFETTDGMQEILKATEGTDCLFIVGFVERSRIQYDVYDSVALLSQGKALGVYRKIHIGAEESHFFIPGPEPEVFRTRLGNIGMGICYDMVFPEQARVLAVKGAEIVVFPSGMADWGTLRLVTNVHPVARALENRVFFIYCNGVGLIGKKEYQLRFMGESKIVSPLGEIVAQSTTDQEEVITSVLKKSDLEKAASTFSNFMNRQIGTYLPLTQPYC